MGATYSKYYADLFLFINNAIQIAVYVTFVYYFIISLFGFIRRNEPHAGTYKPVTSFACVIAAHNEEKVIGNVVDSLKEQNYPRELFDIYVIADNCSDNTAKVALEHGAIVYRRTKSTEKGKGYAIEWMFERIFRMDKKYDAICIFDADNLVAPEFLLEMNKSFSNGQKIVQGYVDTKNPYDSLTTMFFAVSFWLNNRLVQMARYNLGLNCILCGTGFAVSTDVLKKIGWGSTCLTEDLEFSLKAALNDYRITWAHEAVVYDEKPLTMAQSWKQRKRWMQGHNDCIFRFVGELVNKAARENSLLALDCAMYLVQAYIFVIYYVSIGVAILDFVFSKGILKLAVNTPTTYLNFILFTTIIEVITILLDRKFSLRVFLYLFIFPIINLTWIPIIVQGFLDRNKKEWIHTQHSRALSLDEVRKYSGALLGGRKRAEERVYN